MATTAKRKRKIQARNHKYLDSISTSKGRSFALALVDNLLDQPDIRQALGQALTELAIMEPVFFLRRVVMPLMPKEIMLKGSATDAIQLVLNELDPAKLDR